MRTSRPVLLVLLCLLAPVVVSAQSSTSTSMEATASDPQAVSLLQQSLTALTGGAPATDVTMTGAVTVTKSGGLSGGAGSSQSGSVTLVATGAGKAQTTTTTPSGISTTIQDASGSTPTMSISSSDGTQISIRTVAAATPYPSWFYPPFLMETALSSAYCVSYVGPEIRNGVPVQHLAIWRSTETLSSAPWRPSQHELYLNSSTLLPVAIVFFLHGYNEANPSLSPAPYRGNSPGVLTEIDFSDYQLVHGLPVAFRIQSAMTVLPFDTASDLLTDLLLSSVSFNTGVTIASN